jgi:hypothetical protein
MKTISFRILSFVLGCTFFSLTEAATLAEWSLTMDGTPSNVATHVSAGDFTGGSGISSVNFGPSGAYAHSWSTGGYESNDYFQITIAPEIQNELNITDIRFRERRSLTGPRDYQVQWSTDSGFTAPTTLSTVHVPDDDAERDGSISGLGIDVAEGETLYVRFFGYAAEGGAGTWRIGDSSLRIEGTITETVPPTVTEVTAVPTPTNDTTPNYTFHTTEAGTISYGGDCSSSTTTASVGNNTITFDPLGVGIHSNCTITITDAAHNSSNALPVSSFEIDTTPPVVSEETAVLLFTTDSTPDYTFSTTEAGTISYGGNCLSAATTASVGNNTITFNALVDGTHANCVIQVTDTAGNVSNLEPVSSFTVDTTAPNFSGISVASTNADPTLAKPGDVLNFSLNLTTADTSGGGVITFSIGSTSGLTVSIPTTDTPSTSHRGTYTVLPGQNGEISITGITFTDNVAHPITGFTAPVIPAPTVTIDTQAPSLDSASISTSGNPGWAKEGQTVSFTMNFDENVTATINGASTAMNASLLTQEVDIVGGTMDTIVFTVQNGDNGTITPTVDFTISDGAGNETIINTLGTITGGPIIADTIDPTLNPVTIASSNPDPTRAKTNDTVAVSFTADETIQNVSGTMFGESSVLANTSGNNWESALMTDGNEPEGNVAFTLDFSDLAGNSGTTVQATTNGSAVEFDRTDPAVSSVTIQSNNTFLDDLPTYYAKSGETITVTFTAVEPIQTPTGTLLGKAPIFANPAGNIWTATVTGAGGDDEGTVPFSLDITDLAGNNDLTLTTTTDGTSVLYDRTAPDLPTVITDQLGATTTNFKHRANARFRWNGHTDLDETNTFVGSGIFSFDVEFVNAGNGTNQTKTVLAPKKIFKPNLPLPHDDPYVFRVTNVTDKAGNTSGPDIEYQQKYTIGLVGQIVDQSGNPISGAIVQVASRYNDTCDTGKELCSDTTDSNGNYSIVLQKDRDYNVTIYQFGYYLAKKEIRINQVDTTLNVPLTLITSPRQTQTFDQTITLYTKNTFINNSGEKEATKIFVKSLSGELTVDHTVSGQITITSLSRITSITSNNPRLSIIDNGDNTFTIQGISNVSSSSNITFLPGGVSNFGLVDHFDSGDSRLGVRLIDGTGKAGSRQSGQRREEGVRSGKFWAPEQSKAFAQKSNEGTKGTVSSYINRNGYVIFAGYNPGKLGLDRYKKRFQNQIAYRGPRRMNQSLRIQDSKRNPANLKQAFTETKQKFQKKIASDSPKITYAGFKRPKPKHAIQSVLAAKTYYKSRVNKFERKSPKPLKQMKSRIRGKNMTVVKMRIGGKSLSLDQYASGSRRH